MSETHAQHPGDLQRTDGTEGNGRIWVVAYLATTGLVVLLMMLLGLIMRLAQSEWLALDPILFYQIMTVHGTGMVGIAALGGVAVIWHFLSAHVALRAGVLGINFVLFLIGVVAILAADFVGGFAAAWTFLYPLPGLSGAVWPLWAAELHLGGLLVIGVGFLLVCLEAGRGLIVGYGGLGRALGWPKLFLNHDEQVPPPTVVASTMVVIVTTPALIAAAVVIVMSLVNLFVPSVEINPLLAKNLIYFFGHTFINATIYMTVTVVYELLPRITGRPWKTTRVFLAAWTLSTTMVLVIFPHHLLMDFAMPKWALALGQVLSYVNSFPILIVTGLGALAILHRSGIRWDLVSTLLLISMFGWMAGVVPAVVDATIVVNSVMHNTVWVPGHFHFYLLLGLLPMIFAFMIYLGRGEDVSPQGGDLTAILYFLFGLGFVIMFLVGGWASVPRRWAVHLPEWMIWDQIASVMAAGVTVLAGVFVAMFLARIRPILRGGWEMWRAGLAALAVALLGGSVLWWGTDGGQALTAETARRRDIAASPRALPEVALRDQGGAAVALSEFRGAPLLMEFIYTGCADICVTLGSAFEQVDRAAPGAVRLLSVSFDPADGTDQLDWFAERHGATVPRWRVARVADDAARAALMARAGVVVIADGMGGFVHNAGLYLVDRQGRLVRVLTLTILKVWSQHSQAMRREVRVGFALVALGVTPAMAGWLEASLVAQLLGQYPLLVGGGALIGQALGRRGGVGWTGAPALLGGVLALLFWLIPRWIDAAVADPAVDAAKATTLVLLAGVPLGWGWRLAGPVLRGFVWANAAAMLALMGWLQLVVPQRLCNSYLLGEQALLGTSFLGLAGLILAIGAASAMGVSGAGFGGRREEGAGRCPSTPLGPATPDPFDNKNDTIS